MDVFAVRIRNVRIKPDWKPVISAHAVLRFMERVHGVDLESIRDEMRSHAVKQAIVFGAGYVERSDCTLVIDGNTVVTVLDKGMRPKGRSKRATLRANDLIIETMGHGEGGENREGLKQNREGKRG